MNKLQVLTLLGIFGSLLLYAGDMILYYEPVSGLDFNSTLKMSTVSMNRLIIGGLMGPISSVFSLAACYMLFLIFRPYNKVTAGVLGISLGVFFIFLGTYHALFANLGIAGRLPETFREEQILLVESYLGVAYYLVYIPLIIWTLLLFYFVILKKTTFPGWLLVLTPTLTTLLILLIKDYIPYPLGAITYGGWINLSFILFLIICFILITKGRIIHDSPSNSRE